MKIKVTQFVSKHQLQDLDDDEKAKDCNIDGLLMVAIPDQY